MDWSLSSKLLTPSQKASRFHSLGLLCCGGCLKRLQLPWVVSQPSTIIIEPDPEPELSAYEELESGLLNIGSEEDAFYDARSEISDERHVSKSSKSSKVRRELSNEPWKASHVQSGLSEQALAASQRLEALLSIKRLCQSGESRGTAVDKDGRIIEVEVEQVLAGEAQLWICRVAGGTDMGCSTCRVAGVQVAEVVEALHNPLERLRWDCGIFSQFEILVPPEPSDALQKDVIYCVMPGPGLATDRDVLQDRWKVPMDTGQAILMQSKTDNSLWPVTRQRIRAFTHLSGYVVCSAGEGLEITAVSQTDLGGNIPAWVQSQGRRMAKSKLAPWAKKLQGHCQLMRAERRVPGVAPSPEVTGYAAGAPNF